MNLPPTVGKATCDSEERVPVFPDRLMLLCEPLMHGLAGPFLPRGTVEQYQQTVRPPHSKFHPVPTRPVFAPPLHAGRFGLPAGMPDGMPPVEMSLPAGPAQQMNRGELPAEEMPAPAPFEPPNEPVEMRVE